MPVICKQNLMMLLIAEQVKETTFRNIILLGRGSSIY
jgi:hypothetical protein